MKDGWRDPGRHGLACRRGRRRLFALLTLTAILMFTSCSSSPSRGSPGSASPSPSVIKSTSDHAVRLVVLGDSIALGETCVGCTTYPEQLATAMGDSLGVEVETRNLAVPGAEVADLLKLVRTDSTVQSALTEADAILVTIGINRSRLRTPRRPVRRRSRFSAGQMEFHARTRASRRQRPSTSET